MQFQITSSVSLFPRGFYHRGSLSLHGLGIKQVRRPGRCSPLIDFKVSQCRRQSRSLPILRAARDDGSTTPQPSAAISKLILGGTVTAGAFVFGTAVYQGYDFQSAVPDLEKAVAAAGPFGGPLYFLAAYTLAGVLLFPVSSLPSPLTLAAGHLFGPVAGIAIVSLSSTLSASLAFLIAHFGARPLIEPRLQGNPTIAGIDRRLAAQNGSSLLLLRASWLGTLPYTCAYVLLGDAGLPSLHLYGDHDGVKLGLHALGFGATSYATYIIDNIVTDAKNETTVACGGEVDWLKIGLYKIAIGAIWLAALIIIARIAK